MIERFLDIIISLLALIIMLPLMLPVIFILLVTGEHQVFYIQQRIGFGGRRFGLLKFATMLKDSPNIGAGQITIKEDPRVLPFGKYLRKTKINELPQLWNILIGEMSVVGPRPMVPETYAKYTKSAKEKLNTVRPGLTGIGSIVFRDEEQFLSNTHKPIDFYENYIIPHKSAIEIWFIENKSLLVYTKVVATTAWVLIFPKSNIAEKMFKGIPILPETLQKNE